MVYYLKSDQSKGENMNREDFEKELEEALPSTDGYEWSNVHEYCRVKPFKGYEGWRYGVRCWFNDGAPQLEPVWIRDGFKIYPNGNKYNYSAGTDVLRCAIDFAKEGASVFIVQELHSNSFRELLSHGEHETK